jgi:hypothetical protein
MLYLKVANIVHNNMQEIDASDLLFFRLAKTV